MSLVDTVVIGAGVAGLATARRLHAAGRAVMVMEARDRIGGRAFSPPIDGHPVDLGASWVWDHEVHVQALIEALGLATYLPWTKGAARVQHRGQDLTTPLPTSWSPERRIVGGTQALAEGLAVDCPPVELERVVTAIEPTAQGLEVLTSRGAVKAHHVVVALPPALLARTITLPVLDDRMAELYRHTPVWMGDIAKVVATFPRPFWRDAGLSGRAATSGRWSRSTSYRAPTTHRRRCSASCRAPSPGPIWSCGCVSSGCSCSDTKPGPPSPTR